jgi:hypothetical protein
VATTGSRLFVRPASLPNITPTPKLNRYAESAMLSFRVNETKMLAVQSCCDDKTNLKMHGVAR